MTDTGEIAPSDRRIGGWSEFARGWRVLFGATLGVGLGISGLLTYNIGLFTVELTRDVGLSPGTYGAALLGFNVALAVAMPVAARMVDRFGPRITAATGATVLAVGFLALSRIGSVAAYAAVLLLIGFCASLSSPVAHTRAVAAAFDRRRGLALGITQVGIGLAAALVPPIVASQIAEDGWRSGFVLLAALAAAGIVPILAGLPGRSVGRVERRALPIEAPDSLMRSGTFWLQLAAFTAMALAFIGIIAHFVPMLRTSGMSLPRAGALAGAIGMSVIVTRIVVGWLADRFEPAWLGAASCLVCAGGALAMALGGPELALVACPSARLRDWSGGRSDRHPYCAELSAGRLQSRLFRAVRRLHLGGRGQPAGGWLARRVDGRIPRSVAPFGGNADHSRGLVCPPRCRDWRGATAGTNTPCLKIILAHRNKNS